MTTLTTIKHICDICGLSMDEDELARIDVPGEKYSDGHQYVRDTESSDVCIECSKFIFAKLIGNMNADGHRRFSDILKAVSESRRAEMQKAEGCQKYARKKIKELKEQRDELKRKKAIAEADDCI